MNFEIFNIKYKGLGTPEQVERAEKMFNDYLNYLKEAYIDVQQKVMTGEKTEFDLAVLNFMYSDPDLIQITKDISELPAEDMWES